MGKALNTNLIRGSLFGGGAGLVVYAFPVAFITDWFWVLPIVGAVMIMAGGFIDYDDDYPTDEHDDDRRPVWPAELGGIE